MRLSLLLFSALAIVQQCDKGTGEILKWATQGLHFRDLCVAEREGDKVTQVLSDRGIQGISNASFGDISQDGLADTSAGE